MTVVLDTNVLVSALLRPWGKPAEILRMVMRRDLSVAFDARVLGEYTEVLQRPRFGFPPRRVRDLIDHVRSAGQRVVAAPLPKPLPDPDDEVLLSVAIAARAEALVTGNKKDYPRPSRQGIAVLSPAEFLAKAAEQIG